MKSTENQRVETSDEQFYRAYHAIPELDVILTDVLKNSVYADEHRFVRAAQLGAEFSFRTGRKLNDAIAEGLGIPSMSGVATRYLKLNPLYEGIGEGVFQAFRTREEVRSEAERHVVSVKTKDAFVKAHFREDDTLDNHIVTVLSDSFDADTDGFVPVVDLERAFVAQYGIRLSEAIAKVLGIPVMPGLNVRYLTLHPRFEVRDEGQIFIVRERGRGNIKSSVDISVAKSDGRFDKDALVRDRFRVCLDIDERIADCLRDSCDCDGEGYVLLVMFAGMYRARYGVSINEDIARSLGLPSFPGLTACYLRLNESFEVRTECEGGEVSFRLRPQEEWPQEDLSLHSSDESLDKIFVQKSQLGASTSSLETQLPVWVERFAYLKWDALLAELARVAQKENWGERLEVLKSKIQYTFVWLARRYSEEADKRKREEFLYFDESNLFVIMNVGLITPAYEEIYLVFQRNRNPGMQPWFANEFCVSTQSGQNCRLLKSLGKRLPKWPAFLSAKAGVSYAVDASVTVPFECILRNLSRFPEMVLARFCKNVVGVEILLQTALRDRDESREWRAESFQAFERAFVNTPICTSRLETELSYALGRCEQRLRLDYRTLVPFYYPPMDSISFMLPLSFTPGDPMAVDVILVVSYNRLQNRYEGHTILTKQMAYGNARLIAKPFENWLM